MLLGFIESEYFSRKKRLWARAKRLDCTGLRTSALASAILLYFSNWTWVAPPDASWSGVLQDNSGPAIVGVTVILSNVLRQGCLYGANKASGVFLFSAIAPATYKVAVVTEAGIFETARSLVVTEVSTLKTNLQLSTADAGLVLI